jgi:hypothetical protein
MEMACACPVVSLDYPGKKGGLADGTLKVVTAGEARIVSLALQDGVSPEGKRICLPDRSFRKGLLDGRRKN